MANETKMNIDDVMDILGAEVHKLRAEETTPQAVQSISNALGKWLSAVKLKMVYAQMVGVTPNIDVINVKPLKPKLTDESDDSDDSDDTDDNSE